MANLITFTDENFQDEVLKAKEPVLVDFWAAWCGPCKMITPVVEELAGDFAGKAKIGKLNVDEYGKTAQEYGVMSIPTLIIFKDGKEQNRIVGFRPKGELSKAIEQAL
ncbi:MAG: thioredoxin [Clostridiaceae bacterium BRH_c20a]|nr:MAG: thioredoxin [Clostridiaceae bacterium BRH_c20a]KJS21158.1 MAG: thioredoxin [Clostridiaceae bacterium BRH_c20a]